MTKWDKATWLFMRRFAVLVAAAERERAIVIAKNMKEELEAKFEQTYMEGVIAGAAAEREACAKVCEEPGWNAAKWCADRIRARGKDA
jgi:2-keto-4-pentenoate hydratase